MKMTKILLIGLAMLVLPLTVSAQDDVKERLQKRVDQVKSKHPRAAIGKGTVTAISGSSLTVVSRDGKTYTVLTGDFEKCDTKLVRRYGGKSELAEMAVGDEVAVVGRWQDESKTSVEACVVRDLSIQKRHAVFVGEVKSLTSDGWVMSTVGEKRADQTVKVTSSTKFVNRKEEVITQADVKVDHRIRVKGLWNSKANTVTEVTHVKDYSLPEKTQ